MTSRLPSLTTAETDRDALKQGGENKQFLNAVCVAALSAATQASVSVLTVKRESDEKLF
jgi:hypothetical protein